MPLYTLDPKHFGKKGFKYLVIYDQTNKQACVYSKKINLELGIDCFMLSEINEELVEQAEKNSALIIVLGGDGFLLKTLHLFILVRSVCFYGINFGTVGFLLNQIPSTQDLISNIESSIQSTIYPLRAKIKKTDSQTLNILAVNEISLLRQTNQASNIEILINSEQKMKCLVSDGILISTPAGSTAYNFSVHGPILDPDSNLLSICPISPFRPRHWRGALVKDDAEIVINVLHTKKRPTSLSADFYFEPDILSATITLDRKIPINLLFNKTKTLSNKVIDEQFLF